MRYSNSVKKEQSQSINPDTIKCTDVRSINGWDASIQPYIPVELRNQWLSCVTTSPYDGANSEALCQLLISADKAIHASRRMDNNGNWLPWKVSDLGVLLNGYVVRNFIYDFAYTGSGTRVEKDINVSDIGFKTVNTVFVTIKSAGTSYDFTLKQLYAFPYQAPNFVRVGLSADKNQTYILNVAVFGTK